MNAGTVHHGQPQRRATRSAAADDHIGAANRDVGAGHERTRRWPRADAALAERYPLYPHQKAPAAVA
jgi:hypothetical protein